MYTHLCSFRFKYSMCTLSADTVVCAVYLNAHTTVFVESVRAYREYSVYVHIDISISIFFDTRTGCANIYLAHLHI